MNTRIEFDIVHVHHFWLIGQTVFSAFKSLHLSVLYCMGFFTLMNFLLHKSHKLKYKKNWDGELTQNFLIRTRPVTFQWISCSILTNGLDNRPNKVSLVRSVHIHHSELSTHSRLLQIDPSVRRQVGGTAGAVSGAALDREMAPATWSPPESRSILRPASTLHLTHPPRTPRYGGRPTALTLTHCNHFCETVIKWISCRYDNELFTLLVYHSFNLFPDPFAGAHSCTVSRCPVRAVMWGREVPSLACVEVFSLQPRHDAAAGPR